MNYLKRLFPILVLILFLGCENDRKRDLPEGQNEAVTDTLGINSSKMELGSVNFYLENSGSMNGYANGNTDFKKSIVELLSDLELLLVSPDSVKINLVNMAVYPYDGGSSDFKREITTKGVPAVGDVSNSDINLIFKKLLSETKPDQVSILVTDAIYSLEKEKSCDDLIGLLETEAFETRNLFINEMADTNLSTLVLKMTSKFDGKYYPAEGGIVELDQDRPYYFWFFGDSQILKEINDKVGLAELPGFIDDLYVLKNNQPKIPFSILEFGEGKIGDFENENSRVYPVTSVKYKRKGHSDEFGFAIAADLSQVPLPETYLLDYDKYNSSSDVYNIYDVKSIGNGNIDQKTLDHIKKIENEIGSNFTHIFFVKSKEKFIQNFTISRQNEISDWINQTGTDCDTNIEGDSSTTFGFDKLTSGVIDAYDRINTSNDYITISIKVKS